MLCALQIESRQINRTYICVQWRDVMLQNRTYWYRNLFILLVSLRRKRSDIALRGRHARSNFTTQSNLTLLKTRLLDALARFVS